VVRVRKDVTSTTSLMLSVFACIIIVISKLTKKYSLPVVYFQDIIFLFHSHNNETNQAGELPIILI
jgi:hypothetical protein